jgi:hypothetical protein
MTAYLFLGGGEDGEILHVDPELWDVRILASNTALNSDTSILEVREENYMRRRLVSETGTEFDVFALSDWTGDMVIRHLLLRATKES